MIITISGTPGSGKSTVAKLLAKKLGFKHYSMGSYQRERATENGISIEEYMARSEREPALNKMADDYQRKLGKTEDDFIIDGRLSWHFMPQSFKIFLVVDPKIAGERIFRDHLAGKRHSELEMKNVSDAIKHMSARRDLEVRQFKAQYGVDFLDRKHYDFVLDTEGMTVEKVTDAILSALKKAKP